MILQGSLVPKGVEALRELEETGWSGMACLSVRLFNPFPEEHLVPWVEQASRIVVLDRSNSFGSVPPLASRVLSTLGRVLLRDGDRSSKSFRTLVGGLGGREITVREMKEILLSTHLLFSPLEEWEGPLVARWLVDDPVLKALLEEAAALDLRGTNRHTRVPRRLRPLEAESVEYAQRLDSLARLLLVRDYSAFLGHFHRVEFVAPREVLRETSLLQQIVIHVELRLAREALKTSHATWRHAALLMVYSQDPGDRELAKHGLQELRSPLLLTPRLLEQWGVSVQMSTPVPGAAPTDPESACGPGRDASPAVEIPGPTLPEPVPFDPVEVERIESILAELVRLQGEKPLCFNPEDYEKALLERLRQDQGSWLFRLEERMPPDEAGRVLWDYQCCYRDAIDRALQWEVLGQHHVPELKSLCTGPRRLLMTTLVQELKQALAELPPDRMQTVVMEELERYFVSRCLTDGVRHPMIILEFFRNWLIPELLGEAGF